MGQMLPEARAVFFLYRAFPGYGPAANGPEKEGVAEKVEQKRGYALVTEQGRIDGQSDKHGVGGGSRH